MMPVHHQLERNVRGRGGARQRLWRRRIAAGHRRRRGGGRVGELLRGRCGATGCGARERQSGRHGIHRRHSQPHTTLDNHLDGTTAANADLSE